MDSATPLVLIEVEVSVYSLPVLKPVSATKSPTAPPPALIAATSVAGALIMGVAGGVVVGVAVGVCVGVAVGVFVGVAVCVFVGVAVGVFVGVTVGVVPLPTLSKV